LLVRPNLDGRSGSLASQYRRGIGSASQARPDLAASALAVQVTTRRVARRLRGGPTTSSTPKHSRTNPRLGRIEAVLAAVVLLLLGEASVVDAL
jgi:hypothetical protein